MKKRRAFETRLFFSRCLNGLTFIFILDDFTNVAIKGIANLVKDKAVVPDYLILVIIVDHMVLNFSSFRKLVPTNIMLFKQFVKGQFNHFRVSPPSNILPIIYVLVKYLYRYIRI